MNPYKVLDLPYSADMQTVKKRFRQLCIAYHPDKVEGKEKEFRDVVSAFKMIENGWNPALIDVYESEPVSRPWYDYDEKSYDEEVFWKWFRTRVQHDLQQDLDFTLYLPWVTFIIVMIMLYFFRPFG
tara:strand:+ start:1004 stop:1384 length:381 start_codon:yes stop_codon:yes gene_type:complete